ncbi:unnamed protein product [Phytophthora fragariaefolia]|uniref:Unnamed protein product n=1 Tax=Phytophthora fragariaefolia TaxID=1490495 RepID=A0A9W6TSS7_9STRA|nr:unnamed protein product [Phytophthora fragariaefolia]
MSPLGSKDFRVSIRRAAPIPRSSVHSPLRPVPNRRDTLNVTVKARPNNAQLKTKTRAGPDGAAQDRGTFTTGHGASDEREGNEDQYPAEELDYALCKTQFARMLERDPILSLLRPKLTNELTRHLAPQTDADVRPSATDHAVNDYTCEDGDPVSRGERDPQSTGTRDNPVDAVDDNAQYERVSSYRAGTISQDAATSDDSARTAIESVSSQSTPWSKSQTR